MRGASRLAIACRISPLVVGLTVVAFGTSAPELVVCMQSAFSGEPEVAVGNVVGSNIANVLLILGLSAVITPLIVQQQLIRLDVPLMVFVSLVVAGMAWNGNISQLEGAILAFGLVVYNIWVVRKSRKEQKSIEDEYAREFGTPSNDTPPGKQIAFNLFLLIVGLLMLIGGARLFLDSAVGIARSFGVSELVIGLTLVAVGTSLPEVATSVIAAYKGERDIAVGNVVGSNLFNLLGVLGITSASFPGGIPIPESAVTGDIPIMLLVSIGCMPVFFTGHQIARWECFLFLFYYFAYTADIALNALGSPKVEALRFGLIWIAAPVTVLSFVLSYGFGRTANQALFSKTKTESPPDSTDPNA